MDSSNESIQGISSEAFHAAGAELWKDSGVYEFVDPLTHLIMQDPVVAADRHSYDRQSIAEWIASKGLVSPMTREALASGDLTPNTELQAKIHLAFAAQHDNASLARRRSARRCGKYP